MTNNEIIKALECCYQRNMCRECPCCGTGKCRILKQEAASLIKRQQAEIERLEAMVGAAEDHFYPLPFKNMFDEYVEKTKAETIKEFAEFLISYAETFRFNCGGIDCKTSAVRVENILNLVEGREE